MAEKIKKYPDDASKEEQQALAFLAGSYIQGVVSKREPRLQRLELQVLSPQTRRGGLFRETTGTVVIEVNRLGDLEISLPEVEYRCI